MTKRWRTKWGWMLTAPWLWLLAAGCDGTPSEPSVDRITELPRSLTVAESQAVSASNGFAWELLARTVAGGGDTSAVVSPLSASIALGMALNGATGATLDQMRQTLGVGGLSVDALNASYQGLADLLLDLDPTLTVQVANSVWYRNGFAVETPFLDALRTFFDAEVAGLDFNAPSAVTTINDWVDEKTRGRIPDIVEPPIHPLTVMFLINAVYFKGSWTYEFDRGDTRDQPFHRDDGTTATVPLMSLEADLRYAANGDVEMVELPYGGGAYAMNVLLPRSGGGGVDGLLTSLDAARWESLLSSASERAGVTALLPRFRIEFEKTLNGVLQSLGMVDAFDPRLADFTPIYAGARRDGLHITKVKQKAFIEVNEEGTEAAAATSVEFRLECGGCGPPVFRADRPFVFLIRERLSGTIMFAGVFRGPTR